MIGNEIYGTSAEHDTILYHVNIVQILFCSMSRSLSCSLALLLALAFRLLPSIFVSLSTSPDSVRLPQRRAHICLRLVRIFFSSSSILYVRICFAGLDCSLDNHYKIYCLCNTILIRVRSPRFTYTQFVLFSVCLSTAYLYLKCVEKKSNSAVSVVKIFRIRSRSRRVQNYKRTSPLYHRMDLWPIGQKARTLQSNKCRIHALTSI